MPRKIDFITALYKETVKNLTKDTASWRAFLHSAAYQYKYPFADQVLIHAQRPFATACTELEVWNTHFGRWVNRGAKGIALIREKGGRSYLEHVFDVGDTHHLDNVPFELWQVKKGYEFEIAEALENRFGDVGSKADFANAVATACASLVQENIQDYVRELYDSAEGSFLDDLDDDNLRYRLMLTTQASVTYAVLTRLGLEEETEVHAPAEAFEWIHEFNTPATINILGTAAGDMTEICLREIERTAKFLDKENRTFDKNEENRYNDGGKTNDVKNGGERNDIDLQNGGERVAVPESIPARTDDDNRNARQVRTNEVGVFEEASQGNVHDASDRSEVDGTLDRGGQNRESADLGEYIPTGDEPWGIGEAESREPDGVGADDELDQAISGGRSVDVPNSRITDEKLPAIADPDSLIQILRHGDFLHKSKDEIVSFLRSDALSTEKAEYIKNVYSPLTFIEFKKQGTEEHLGYRADADSLLVYEGNFPSRKSEMRLEWDFVAKLIGALIKDRNYLDEPKAGQQLSLMDVENGVAPAVEEPKPTAKQFGISQEIIDDLLRLGGCTRNSNMRIYEFYRRAKGTDETIAFLRREYETDFVGITVDGKNYAAKWDENGIRFSTGERVSEYSSAFIPWESVDKRIRELMNLGQYLSKDEQEKAKDVWEDYISGNVRSLLYDSFENIPEERKFWLNKSLAIHESVKLFEQKLHDPEKGEMLVKQARECVPLLEEYPPRFRYARNTDDKIFFIEMQLREPIDFPEADPYIMPPKQFVTQDFFDNALLRQGTKNRLKYYSFFLRERDLTKRAKYIQDSFGIGGSGGGRFNDNHDSKGWVIYGGLQNSSMGMHLKWSQVAKRMDEFIRQGKYLTNEDKAQMDSYERHEVAAKIKRFFITKSPDIVQPLGDKRNDDFWGAVDEITKQIESKERLLEIVGMMQQAFENEQPGEREYDNDKQLFEDVKGYSEGTFNLFPHSPYRKKTPFAPEKKVVEQEPTPEVEKPTEKEMPEIEYDLHLGVTVHIGKDECDILSLSGDTVELFDGTLIPLEMDFDTFMKRIRENPLNDHLLKEPKPARAEYKEEKPKVEPPKKTRQSKKNQVTVESIVRQIEDSYNTWDAYMNGGGSDPTWEDGCNMNLVRNHIIYYRQQLLGMCSEDQLPEIFNRELPPEVSNKFMAQPDRIREDAQRALEVYKSNETYQWCKAQAERIPEKMLKKTTIPNILGYVSGLEHAIENDELVAMRRHRNPERYLDSFDRCKREIEKILPQIEHDQRTDDIFAALMNEGKEVEQGTVTDGVERLSIPQKTDIWERFTITKIHYPDHLALIRVGDFYELFENDAVEASDTLGLTLTGRDVKDKPTRVPMCGFPYHTMDKFLQKLLDKGYKVAIAEEDKTFPMKETTVANKDYNDAEIADILPAQGKDILRLYEYRFSDDRFYVDGEKGTVTWIYFNPDSASKGQFIENVVTFEQIAALMENEDYTVFFDKLGSEAKQYIVDSDDKEFRDTAYRFLTEEYTFRGFGSEAMEQLVSVVENYEQGERRTEDSELSNRFSIRRMPFEGGIVAIWDDAIKKYYGEGQIYRFAEQDNAIEYLKNLQRENGIPEAVIFTTKNGNAYHIGDTLFASFDEGNGVHIEIERVDEDDVWYTMPSEPGQDAVAMNRVEFEKYLDTGNFSVLFSKYVMPVRTTEDRETENAEVTASSVAVIEEVDEIERAKEYLRDFFGRAYGDDDAVFDDLSKIPIAHTTTENEELFVQVNVNLIDRKIEKYLGDDLIEIVEYETLKGLNDNELSALDFDDLVAVSDEEIAEYKREHGLMMPAMVEPEKPKRELPVYNSHPEIPNSEKHNYRITDDNLGVGGAKEKFKRNMAAINLLHELEFENRLATPEEQEILAQYTGWGGLSDAFDESKDNWASEFQELYTTLSPEEYNDARASTLTAFYTPPVVIRAMYDALERMGLKRGNLLEPSCGTGNFMGMLPESMEDCKIYGVELDSLSGRIARQLYQKNGITISGYEKTHFPDSFFDVAIGNVPFGHFKVVDKKYDKHNFLIHDYFFAKTLDKVRPGGVVAFVTSCGTLDKESPAVRKYLAQRADLIGAIRLPDTAFKDNAGTRVVSDIIFLQKRDRILDTEPDWVHLGYDENGIPMNQYFIDNPDMVLGEMVMRSGPFGDEPTCRAYEGQDLGEALKEAVANINAEIEEIEVEELSGDSEKTLPADPTVKNFSYTLVDGKVYYRENSIMTPVETTVTGENRIKGMIAIRDTVRELIDAQLDDAPDSEIKALQDRLNEQYDTFTNKYGLINSRGNSLVFSDDNAYFLLCSLEILDDNKELKAKADMFTKRTIKPQKVIERVDTASEALAVSLGERAMVDMEFMSELTGKTEEELYSDLKGVIYLNPKHSNMLGHRKYLMADEYLSGNVREKLAFARRAAEEFSSDYDINVEALEKVQPQDLTASEIGVKLGSVWIPPEDIHDFIHELLGNSYYVRRLIEVKFIPHTAQWVLTNKTKDRGNVKANSVYGTKCVNAYEIIEETLNLKDVRVYDYVVDEHGNKKAVLNKKETTIAQGKQEQIKRAFEEWIWKDPERRERLCKLYNEKFNSIRPREYDGNHIKYYGMNPEIKLRKHQTDAVARIMYGGNSLLAHVVGAGKTFTMVAAAQESKRLGLCNKSMFVVPNHLIEQWATEYLQLYPSANILVATKKDFETKNRKKFCARIATGDYDAVIIGHSQFEKIPVSVERQIRTIETEIQEIMVSMSELQYQRGERVTVKQLERAKKHLETKLEKLNDQTRKDDVVTFEELGVDRLFVDEAHFYKNLAAYSKMRNVAGISQTEAQKSSDLYMKCRYLDELTGGKGCVFATGTPISNTMVELYTMQKYLQYDELKERGLLHFDAWASTFGETVTAIELAPDGTGYRAKTRFAKFFNIPELMATFKQVADIQTADMLNLPTPEAHFHIVKVEASEMQKDMVQSFAKRAEKIHNGTVKSDEDNMLLVTNDGRKAALDQRLLNPMLEDFEGSKVNNCVQKIYEIWEKNKSKKSAQLVFCDLSTPKNDGSFNVYDDIRNKLIAMGIPSEEIAFIHTADTDTKKKELFGKVRRGQVRVLMGSTFKMGAGTNVQERLIALHDLDVPWRPSDLEQRAGRIVRQGNTNPEVDLYRYVTEGTFDAYSYQLLESKQKFISQIMTSKSPVRIAEDVDETALSYAEIKALASGNPKIMEKMQLDTDVQKLKLQKASHLSQRYALEDELLKKFPSKIAETEERIKGIAEDIKLAEEHTHPNENGFSPMVIMGTTFTEKADAGKAILSVCERMHNPEPRALGEYRGFRTEIGFEGANREFYITLKGTFSHKVGLGDDPNGIITRLDNAIGKLTERKANLEYELGELHKQVENAKAEIEKPFVDEALLQEKCRRLDELNAELNMDKRENEIVDGAEEQTADDQDRSRSSRDNRDDDAR